MLSSQVASPAAPPAVDTALVNDVAMQQKSYSSHAALQHEAMLQTLPLLERAARETSVDDDRPLVLVEYGSAQGNNSLEPLETILSHSRARQVQLLLSDRPENDFNTLSTTVSAWADGLESPAAVFLGMMPRSFYRAVVPPQTVHLGFSLCCLHHLERLPAAGDDAAALQDLCRRQAHADLRLFLRLRAAEVVTGGALVLSFVGRDASGRDNYAGPVAACRRAMMDMMGDGALQPAVAAAFRVPTYDRSLEDVAAVLDELSDVWEACEVDADEVLHPAMEQLERRKRDGDDVAASRQYADAVVDWLMAVCSGYFIKAVGIGCPGQDCGERLLAEWTRRTKERFFSHHRDEPVFCSIIRMRLRRL